MLIFISLPATTLKISRHSSRSSWQQTKPLNDFVTFGFDLWGYIMSYELITWAWGSEHLIILMSFQTWKSCQSQILWKKKSRSDLLFLVGWNLLRSLTHSRVHGFLAGLVLQVMVKMFWPPNCAKASWTFQGTDDCMFSGCKGCVVKMDTCTKHYYHPYGQACSCHVCIQIKFNRRTCSELA